MGTRVHSTTIAKMTNIFSVFSDNEDDCEVQVSCGNPVKKALKKLKEIQALKEKDPSVLNQEELDKVKKEAYWRGFLPNNDDNKPQHPSKEERKAAKLKKKEEQRQKLEREQRRQQNEQRQQEEEQKRRKKEQEKKDITMNEWRSNPDGIKRRLKIEVDRLCNSNAALNPNLDEEFHVAYVKYDNNVNKAFRQLSMKYHPDKNPCGSQDEQKYLGIVKEAYLKVLMINE